MSNIIDGKECSEKVLETLKKTVEFYSHVGWPALAVIQVGKKKDSSIYVKKKTEACEKIGIQSVIYKYDSINTKELMDLIQTLNINPFIHGILVQLPLPENLDKTQILNFISCKKDVDGFHVKNTGSLIMNSPSVVPCTPKGCIHLLKWKGITIKGKHAVVIGKSHIVGFPLSIQLINEGATVTVCHKQTVDIQKHTVMADILIVACGQAEMVKKDWIKKGAVVIDVGINAVDDQTKKKGYRLVGDVDFDEVKNKASFITPVPGGVGPMTVAMLLENTIQCFLNMHNIKRIQQYVL